MLHAVMQMQRAASWDAGYATSLRHCARGPHGKSATPPQPTAAAQKIQPLLLGAPGGVPPFWCVRIEILRRKKLLDSDAA
jgi:hypothetical protein